MNEIIERQINILGAIKAKKSNSLIEDDIQYENLFNQNFENMKECLTKLSDECSDYLKLTVYDEKVKKLITMIPLFANALIWIGRTICNENATDKVEKSMKSILIHMICDEMDSEFVKENRDEIIKKFNYDLINDLPKEDLALFTEKELLELQKIFNGEILI